ncbi:MAG TPA: hypothetical protein VHL52_07575 [Acidimicrobiia bacterium]|nr:hypothetical protein [Acidimicrobiia bacterium]
MPDSAPTDHRLGDYVITVATAFGPRVLGLRHRDGPETFARLGPEVVIGTGTDLFRLRGGHRLWAAPEIPATTYAPDDTPVRVTADSTMVRLSGPPDAAGVGKELVVREGDLGLDVTHLLSWHGSRAASVAAWAITQLPLGGTAIIPWGGRDRDGVQADRSLVLWPYTDPTDHRLTLSSHHVTVKATAAPRLKIGAGPDPGRLGYLRNGWLFSKTVTPAGDGPRVDLGAVGQVFVGEDFCELETLGPLVRLQSGDEVEHHEFWRVEPCVDLADALERMGR